MESRDLELIRKHEAQDFELRALWEQHMEYEKLLNKLEGRVGLSSTQELEIRELKKKKLAGKTKLQLLLDKYRQAEA